ncbi:hypothetical protein K466DRAFT_648057 [Polyporus arcularius HHB13444]|uniref:Uncharacterized protein n=1 Tax=Polyporus arcularius HHB13444 TaxID=1314778 RepID=A0A5C3NY76_9APHY|nr:hypothetical protein K466DRAFT_648057 [Polyporus arcularius HHB13444]
MASVPPAPATVPARDEPAPHTNGSPPASGSPAQLASLLAKALEETESLKQQLDSMKRRADKAERLLASFQSTVQSPTNGSPPGSSPGSPSKPQLSEAARKTIMECENRAERAEQARDEAEARLRMLQESWVELDRFFASAELRNADVRAQFTRLVAQGGGELITIPPIPAQNSIYIPSSLQQSSLPLRAHVSSRSARGMNLASQPFPSVALPPPPSASSSRVRPRAGSMDAGYGPALAGPGAPPPAKRPRSDRDPDDRSRGRGYSISPSNSPHPAYLTNGHAPDHSPQQLAVHPSAAGQPLHVHPRYQAYQPRSHVDRDDPRYAYAEQRRSRRARRSHSRGGRSSRSRSRASSMSLDEMLLEATATAGEDRAGPDEHGQPRALHPAQHLHPSSRHRSPSPGRDYQHLAVPHHSRARASSTVQLHPSAHAAAQVTSSPGPLPAPGQVQTYQTHIFAPPVTGAPVKKTKLGAGSLGANGSVLTLGPTGSVISGPNALGGGGFPPTNAAGQRICRQCGLPGRYKEGKCVEKWGPGPEGPGTVCDRCRKKMKRVERRGTLDSQNLAAQMHHHQPAAIHPSGAAQAAPGSMSNGRVAASQGSDRSIHRTDTMPVHPSQSQLQSRLGPSGTHVLASQSSYGRHEHHDRERERERERDRDRDRDLHSPYRQSQSSYSQSRSSQRGPTPPGIATLPGSSADVHEYERPPRSRDSQQQQQQQHRSGPGANGHASRSGSGSSRSASHSPAMRAVGKHASGSGSGSGSPKSSELMDVDADGEEVDADAEADEVDADADADVDAEADPADPEADADAEAELLEAVDAAEANHGDATDEEWLKKEDA